MNHRSSPLNAGRANSPAALIAPTYKESGNGMQTFAPSPGGLGRGGTKIPNFYVSDNAYNNPPDARRNVDWMTGVGLWQYDDYGSGRAYATEKLTATGLATQTAAYLIGLFCQNSGDVASMFPAATWHGCGLRTHQESEPNDCVYYYDQLYDPATHSLRPISKPVMSDGGGTQKRQCQVGPQQNAQTFDCYLVRPGATTTEHCPPGMCNSDTKADLALSAPFYVWRSRDSAGYVAGDRYWPESSTGGPPYVAKRRNSVAAKTQRLLQPVAQNIRLCDFTVGGSACPAAPKCTSGHPC